jgi:phage recombination protein Bet
LYQAKADWRLSGDVPAPVGRSHVLLEQVAKIKAVILGFEDGVERMSSATTAPQQSTALAKLETSPLILELASDWKINPVTMINTLKATIFPQKDRNDKPVLVSNEMMVAFLQVCHTYKLNPFVKEIYAFPTKGGGIVPMVPIDGWANIVNRNPQMDGLEFEFDWEVDDKGRKKSLNAITCIIYRKDRSKPIRVTEFMQECFQSDKDPWKRWPARMLRHKAMIQCARVAFSLGGIYDPDEAERIAESGEPDKPAIVRPTRASAQTIDGELATTGKAPEETESAQAKAGAGQPAEPSVPASVASGGTGGATAREGHPVVEGAAATTATCFCSCCKSGTCDCPNKEEFDRCGCPKCKELMKGLRPTNAAADSSTNAASAVDHGNAPTSAEIFGPTGGPSKPSGPYITQRQVTKLIIAAKASGVEIKKDSHDDVVHKTLREKYGIESLTEIPVSMFDEILKFASNAGPVKLNAK